MFGNPLLLHSQTWLLPNQLPIPLQKKEDKMEINIYQKNKQTKGETNELILRLEEVILLLTNKN